MSRLPKRSITHEAFTGSEYVCTALPKSHDETAPCGVKENCGTKASFAAASCASTIFTFSAAFRMFTLWSRPCCMRACRCGSVNTSRHGRLPNDAVSAAMVPVVVMPRVTPTAFTSGRSYLL